MEESVQSLASVKSQNYFGRSCCKSCADITDSYHWELREPVVSMETVLPVYKHRSSSGCFECAVSGLRWVCGGEVTLQYQFIDPDVLRAELAMLQYVPIGPLMDIKVLSGELLEAHLPHFACLDGSDSSFRDAVRVLRGVNNSVTLETCELTRFHVKLLKPSFSQIGVLLKIYIPMKVHLDVLIYRTRVTPLTLHTYVVPRDAYMIQAVTDEISVIQDAKRITKPRPDMSIWMNSKFSLTSSSSAEIAPSEITLKYIRPPDWFEVFMEKAEDCFELEVISQGQSIWKAKMRSIEFGTASGNSEEGRRNRVAVDNRGEGEMASLSNEDKHFIDRHRTALIDRVNVIDAMLDLLREWDALDKEAYEKVRSCNTRQNQMRSLIDHCTTQKEKDLLYRALMKTNKFVVEELEGNRRSSIVPSCTVL
ncbi:NACHT, LRR and PYD domains-containing protein 1 homolog [Sardina pilchardus]|uniref:NACHT, LRR and PYD domains-containing protein 1 homolog n=1 Tax=Sardina pilchardus TaxID=27697 RepID=UPI002E117FDE